MRELQHQMVRVQRAQELSQRRPGAFLNGLTSVIPKTEMYRLLAPNRIEHAVDGLSGDRAVTWIAGNVRFVDLDASALQLCSLRRKRIRDGECQLFEIVI